MKRRDFLAGLGAATIWHLSAMAAERHKYRIALVSPATPVSEMSENGNHVYYVPLLKELERLGYVEGKNLELLASRARGAFRNFQRLPKVQSMRDRTSSSRSVA